MGYLKPEQEEEFRNQVNKPVSPEIPESPEGRDYGNIFGRAYRGAVPPTTRYALEKAWPHIDRTLRLLGLPAGLPATILKAPQSLAEYGLEAIDPDWEEKTRSKLGVKTYGPDPSDGFWLEAPDIQDYPEAIIEAAKAAAERWKEGDGGLGATYDTALDVFHEEVGGGPGFWGAAEIAGSMLPTPGSFGLGTKVISKAPAFGRFAGKYLPRTARGVEATARGLGRSLQFPLEAEQAVGRAAGKVLGYPFRKGLEKFRGRPAAKVATPPVTPGVKAAGEVLEAGAMAKEPAVKLAILEQQHKQAEDAIRVLENKLSQAQERLKMPVVKEATETITPSIPRSLEPVDKFTSIAGGKFKHFTTQEAKAQLEAGVAFDPTLLPQHGTGYLGDSSKKFTGKFAGDRLYLSLDDARWSKIHERTRTGKIVADTAANQGTGGSPFYDYDKQKWMKYLDEDVVTNLHPVEFKIAPNARVLEIDSPDSYRDAVSKYGFLRDVVSGERSGWDNIAKEYDAVAIRVNKVNEDQVKFFREIGGSQVIVLNPRVATVVKPIETTVPGTAKALTRRLQDQVDRNSAELFIETLNKQLAAAREAERTARYALPTVPKDVPLNKVVPDNEAGPIVSSADPSPPNPKFDSTPEQAFKEMASFSSPEEIAAMDDPKFRNLLRRLDLIGRVRGLVGMSRTRLEQLKKRPLFIMQTIMRLHEGAINAAQVEAKRIVKGGLRETDLGEPQLRALGMSVSSGDREIILESAIPRMDELNKALHDSTKPIPKGLDRLYEELKNLADWEEIARINFDPTMKTVRDYWYRGWKATKALVADRRNVKLGAKPKFKMPRRDASYEQMREAGYEPLSWNPFEQWRLSRMMGIRYRQQMALLWQLKKIGLWRPSSGSTDEVVEGIIDFTADGKPWRTPAIGPAFEGKTITIADDVLDEKGIKTGETVLKEVQAHRGLVHPKIAQRLESAYGETPAGWEELGPLDMIKIIDKMVFVPKRFKLFGSLFQQFDFLQRGAFGTSGHVMDRLLARDLVGAGKVGLKWPITAVNVIRANFSPGYRQVLKRKLGSTDPLVPGRPGIHWKGLMEAGLSLYDYSIFPPNIGDIARTAAEDVGMLGMKKVKNLILQLETMMRNGLFDGTYPASIMSDVQNNIAPVMVRKWGHLTDAQINGAIVETVNKAYSTLPKNQSVLQNRFFRGFFQRVFFSINESEGLLRQATGAFTGPHAGFWRTRWLGAYVALMGVANTIHMVSTGLQGKPEHLPWDRWVPISLENWGPFPFSYRRDFAAPNIPIKGRGAVELTLDLVMQADTVFRLLNPASFLTSRESVPIRALQNQIQGRDFYGSSITDAGPMGLWSRMASFIDTMFTPIGWGQSLVNIAQEKIPGVASIIPPGAQRVGVPGQIIKGTGLNVRAETTLQYKNRMARESGLINPDTGEPVQTWDELLPGQEDQIERMVPDFQVELQRRTEILAQRGSKYAEIRIDVQKHENDLINKANAISKKRLEVSLTGGDYDPESARKEIGEAEDAYYGQVYGIIWDKEKGRFTGGIYDEDKDFEEPEDDTTVDHALWRYRKIFLDARDPDTGKIDYTGYPGVILNKALNEFWVGLDKRLVPEVINNIRLIEGKYSREMQVMQDAGRYGISLRLTVGATRSTKGETLGYYDLENHKNVETYIVKMTGISRAVIRRYLDKTSAERKAARRTEQGADIGKYLDKAVRRNGELWKLREDFVNLAPSQWLQAMFEAGYDYQDKGNIEQKGIEEKIIKEGKTLPRLNYKKLYMDVLPRQ